MKNWQTKKIGDVLEVERGGSPRPIEAFITNNPNGINWIKIGDTKNITKYIFKTEQKIKPEGLKKSRLVKDGDFILSNSMSFGRPYIMKITGAIHDGWLVLRNKKKVKIDQDYLYYILSSDIVFNQFNNLAAGSTVRNLNISLVKSVTISFPESLTEQKRLVKILDEVFEKIETAKENTEKNLQNSRELFESFLQNTFAKSGEDWKENKLGEIAELIDSLHQTPAYDETGFPMVRVTDIKTGFLDLSKTRKVKKSIFEEFSKRHMPRIGDIVFSRVGSYGVSSLVNTNEPFCLGQNTVFIIPKINCNYLYYFINSRNSKEQIDKLVAGTTQPTISLKSIKDINVPIPLLSEQQAIVNKLDELSEQTKRLEEIYKQKLICLEELKKSILSKAFAGEL